MHNYSVTALWYQ